VGVGLGVGGGGGGFGGVARKDTQSPERTKLYWLKTGKKKAKANKGGNLTTQDSNPRKGGKGSLVPLGEGWEQHRKMDDGIQNEVSKVGGKAREPELSR